MAFGVEPCQRPLENLSLSTPFLHPVISTENVLLKDPFVFNSLVPPFSIGKSTISTHSFNSLKVYPVPGLSKVWTQLVLACFPRCTFLHTPESFFVTGVTFAIWHSSLHTSKFQWPNFTLQFLQNSHWAALHWVICLDLSCPFGKIALIQPLLGLIAVILHFQQQYSTGNLPRTFCIKS